MPTAMAPAAAIFTHHAGAAGQQMSDVQRKVACNPQKTPTKLVNYVPMRYT